MIPCLYLCIFWKKIVDLILLKIKSKFWACSTRKGPIYDNFSFFLYNFPKRFCIQLFIGSKGKFQFISNPHQLRTLYIDIETVKIWFQIFKKLQRPFSHFGKIVDRPFSRGTHDIVTWLFFATVAVKKY